jgi:large subunit ribosomal protein L3
MVVKGILGKKIGMTQVFKDGELVPVTIVTAGPCYVLEIKDEENFGYNAIKLGYEKKEKANKPISGFFKKLGIENLKYTRELRIDKSQEVKKYKVGELIYVDIFKIGEFVDVIGVSKGKGFQGGIKRWGWHIGPKSHGSMSHRVIGSIGASSDPSRVLKGLHMPGHMGNKKVTIQNLEVIDVDKENNALLLKGAIPGARNSFLVIRNAKKKPLVEISPKEEKQ